MVEGDSDGSGAKQLVKLPVVLFHFCEIRSVALLNMFQETVRKGSLLHSGNQADTWHHGSQWRIGAQR